MESDRRQAQQRPYRSSKRAPSRPWSGEDAVNCDIRANRAGVARSAPPRVLRQDPPEAWPASRRNARHRLVREHSYIAHMARGPVELLPQLRRLGNLAPRWFSPGNFSLNLMPNRPSLTTSECCLRPTVWINLPTTARCSRPSAINSESHRKRHRMAWPICFGDAASKTGALQPVISIITLAGPLG